MNIYVTLFLRLGFAWRIQAQRILCRDCVRDCGSKTRRQSVKSLRFSAARSSRWKPAGTTPSEALLSDSGLTFKLVSSRSTCIGSLNCKPGLSHAGDWLLQSSTDILVMGAEDLVEGNRRQEEGVANHAMRAILRPV